MDISVCIGSSCHLKGSYDVIERLKKALASCKLEDAVHLKATFCLGRCSDTGVTIQVDDQVVTGVNMDNFDDVFSTHVLNKLGEAAKV